MNLDEGSNSRIEYTGGFSSFDSSETELFWLSETSSFWNSYVLEISFDENFRSTICSETFHFYRIFSWRLLTNLEFLFHRNLKQIHFNSYSFWKLRVEMVFNNSSESQFRLWNTNPGFRCQELFSFICNNGSERVYVELVVPLRVSTLPIILELIHFFLSHLLFFRSVSQGSPPVTNPFDRSIRLVYKYIRPLLAHCSKCFSVLLSTLCLSSDQTHLETVYTTGPFVSMCQENVYKRRREERVFEKTGGCNICPGAPKKVRNRGRNKLKPYQTMQLRIEPRTDSETGILSSWARSRVASLRLCPLRQYWSLPIIPILPLNP